MTSLFPDKVASKKKREASTSSSGTNDYIHFESYDISDLENYNLLTDDDIIQQNDFVLVQFPLKTSILHVGEVVEILNLEKLGIKYLLFTLGPRVHIR